MVTVIKFQGDEHGAQTFSIHQFETFSEAEDYCQEMKACYDSMWVRPTIVELGVIYTTPDLESPAEKIG